MLWEGPSRLDAAPLAVILTLGASNRKTGDMDQTWILRSDVHPLEAVRYGKDRSICGDCRHRTRGQRSCYVTVQHGPANVWNAYRRGKYPKVTTTEAHARMRGRALRIGAYGDPVMVPAFVWTNLLDVVSGWTGYKHQWANPAMTPTLYQSFLMASVETHAEHAAAQAAGWRTFRTRHALDGLLPGEIVCPASLEAGHKTTCLSCRICRGASGSGTTKSVAIYAHGPGRLVFFRSAQAALQGV